MYFSRPRRGSRVFLRAAVLLAATGACRKSEIKPPVEITRFAQVGSDETDRLQLVKVDSVVLGTAEAGVDQITDFQVHNGRYYVLDGMGKTVRVFDRAGRLIRTIGRAGEGPGELIDPTALSFAGGRMYVADPRRGKRLQVFDEGGRFISEQPFEAATPPVAVAAAGDHVVTMGLLNVSDPVKRGWNVLAVSTPQGRQVGAGCVIDPRYVQSGRRDGMISHYDFGSVAAHGDQIYCTQGISPVVQVMDLEGRPVRQIRLAPPFYIAPRERRLTMNQKEIFDFLGTFTAHARFFPVDGGFVSAYSRFDAAAGDIRYHLFACRDQQQPRCGVVENVGRPIYAESLDTLFVEEEARPNQPMQVGIYRIAGLGR